MGVEDDMDDLATVVSDVEAGIRTAMEADQSGPKPKSDQGFLRNSVPPKNLPAIGTFGPYAIVGRLAMGGMAEILLAREESGGAGTRHLVVKRILAEYNKDQAFVDMFLDEARVMMRLRHPNVCHVYRFGNVDGIHYIAMEWVQGASLGKLIRTARKSGGVPLAIACHIVAGVAEALDHAHNAVGEDGRPLNLVHRDVTPDNIMISYDGSVKLLDFGIAKAEMRAHQTQAGVVKGKFAYMSPEQCRGKELDRRTDIFALGVCLYETLTQRPLYRRDTEFETMEAIVRGPVPRLADRIKNPPPDLERILLKCLAKKPDDRWASAAELQEEVQTYLAKRGSVVSARKVKELMDKLFAAEKQRGPIVDSTPFGSSFHGPSEDHELFDLKSGEMEAFPDDLPLPDLDIEALMEEVASTYEPPPEGEGALEGENQSPGHARVAVTHRPPALASVAADGRQLPPPAPRGGVTPAGGVPPASAPAATPSSSAFAPGPRSDPRRNPTAPERPPRRSAQPQESGRGITSWVAGAVALVVIGGAIAGGVYAYREATREQPIVVTEVEEPEVLTGTLVMATDPEGATLAVDGEERGTTPVTVEELTTGTHTVTLTLEGYEAHEGEVEIRAGRTRSILQPLEALPEEGADPEPTEFGRVNLTATPNVRVFHDGEDLGTTPLRRLRLPAGVVPLELELPSGDRVTRAVLVTANETRPTHLNLD